MIALGVIVTLMAGAVLAGFVSIGLTLLERSLLAVVSGILVSAAITFGLALLGGLTAATVLGGPALIVAGGVVAAARGHSPLGPWRRSLADARAWWRADTARAWRCVALAVAGAAIVAVIFARAVVNDGGAVTSGYATVWADWSQHLTTESSFAIAGNVPPVNPLFSGAPLLYPFLPDFQSAMFVVLGASQATALAVPSALLVLVIAMLVVCLARRLGVGTGGGVVAAVIVFLGGGIGFVGLFGDACTAQGFTAAHCTVQYALTHPGDGLGIIGGTLRGIPGAIAAQPRAYDGLPSDGGMGPLPAMQWYTPLLAWWLPQRTIVYGFAAALCVLVLVYAALSEPRRAWSPFVVAGVLVGLLPIVHIQTLIALAVILALLALRHRRRAWIGLLAAALLLGTPRLLQVAAAPHGSMASGNAYPWFEPGWLAATAGRIDVSPLNAVVAVGQTFRAVFSAPWWGFWAVNLGLAVPLCALLLLGSLAGRLRGRAGAAARRVTSVIPRPLFELFVGGSIVFALCNVVVFQSWDWDNTKLLVYWYLAVALVVGALVTAAARHRWRAAGAGALALSMVLTGIVVMLRFAPWTPATDQVGGPFTVADARERVLAQSIVASTPRDAVFLTFGRPNDPLLTLAGRTSVMGYYGWLWSYGTVFGSRYTDVQQLYAGCAGNACDVPTLLHRYHVSFVEIDDRVDDPGAVTPDVNLGWWSRQGYPVVARSEHITVYDVRGA